MSPLPIRLRDPFVTPSGALSAIIAPRPSKWGGAADPILVSQTAGIPAESLQSLNNPNVPVYRGKDSSTGLAVTRLVVSAIAAGAQVGDLMIVALDFGGSHGTLPTPPGWSALGPLGGSFGYMVYSKVRTASDPDTYFWEWSTAQNAQLLLLAYSADRIDVSAIQDEASTANHLTPAIDVASANCAFVLLVFNNNGTSMNPISGWTERYDGVDGGHQLALEAQDLLANNDAGGKGPFAFTSTGVGTSHFLLALGPPGEGGIRPVPVESLQGVKQSTNSAVEAGGATVQTAGEPIESLGGIKQTAGEPIESLQKLAITGGIPTEWLSLVLAPGSADPLEWLQGIRQTAGEPLESLGGVSRSASAPWESLALLAASGVMPWESLAKLAAQTASLPLESLQGIRASASFPFESRGIVGASAGLPIESLSPVFKTGGFPGEWLARIAAAVAGAPFESLQALKNTSAVPAEWLSRVGVVTSAPLETLALLRALNSSPYEWRDLNIFIHVSQTAGIPFESLGGVVVTAPMPTDIRTGLPGTRLHLSESARSGLLMVEYIEEVAPEIERLVMSEVASGLSMSESGPIA